LLRVLLHYTAQSIWLQFDILDGPRRFRPVQERLEKRMCVVGARSIRRRIEPQVCNHPRDVPVRIDLRPGSGSDNTTLELIRKLLCADGRVCRCDEHVVASLVALSQLLPDIQRRGAVPAGDASTIYHADARLERFQMDAV
jgi:hypothetical protein